MKSTAKLSSIGTHFFKTLLQMPYSLLYAVDPSLGRLDYDSLSDQTLMEMLISGMDDSQKKFFQDNGGNFKDVCEWTGFTWEVKCENERVHSILLTSFKFSERQFPFEFIPPLVKTLLISLCEMHGTLETSHLPRDLIRFEVMRTKLHGTINFGALPQKLESLVISYNDFSGSCALSDLPDTLVKFRAENNNFSGEISLNNLPVAMKKINLSNNKLCGSIDIARLPPSFKSLDLSGNSLTGDFRLRSFPKSLKIITIFGNGLSGTAVFQKASGDMPFAFESFSFRAVLDEDGNPHKWEDEIVCDF